MGYYTDFTLSIVDDVDVELLDSNKKTFHDVLEWVKTLDKESVDYHYFDEMLLPNGHEEPFTEEFEFTLQGKWYERNDSMKHLSQAFPGVVFLLEGKGEEDHDYWRLYAHHGKLQYCAAQVTIEYPEFNPSMLE